MEEEFLGTLDQGVGSGIVAIVGGLYSGLDSWH